MNAFIKFMNWKDADPPATMLAEDELLAITDNDIVGYLEFQA